MSLESKNHLHSHKNIVNFSKVRLFSMCNLGKQLIIRQILTADQAQKPLKRD